MQFRGTRFDNLGVLVRICAGDHASWNDLICSFQKRLFAFAIRQVDRHEDADDLVQETFVSFLKAVKDYRQDCELETFLFQILRRRIVDFYRARGRSIDARACVYDGSTVDNPPNSLEQRNDPALHSERLEQLLEIERRLAASIRKVTQQLCRRNKFQSLQIVEATLYANLSNQEVARVVGCKANKVAMVKHRIIERLAQAYSALSFSDGADPGQDEDGMFSGMLTKAWESRRPSCPKRTTLGKYIFGLLPDQWATHVRFHVELLGCRFCQANLDELRGTLNDYEPGKPEQLFLSTIGFLKVE